MKKILFVTGTRADYGKMKALMKAVESSTEFETFIYVSGMHLIETLGNTYTEVLKDNYKNVHIAYGLASTRVASYDLGDTICNLTGYVNKLKPDMIVVHGDRIDALAGAAVGALSNVRVAHIEGGELSGTIDDSIRHAISKLSHIHLVCNEEATNRLIQMGECKDYIYEIGSPDIDIMLSENLPTIDDAKNRYQISFKDYAIFMYHPVTTEHAFLRDHIHSVVDAILDSKMNYIVIYPNNDLGYEIILNEYQRFMKNERFRLFPSIRFEYFLTFLKNAQFIIGNSSAGVREASVYGLPAIDIGTRQTGRYHANETCNIRHVDEVTKEILDAINAYKSYRKKALNFGVGNSTSRFMELIKSKRIWNMDLQKKFIDFGM